MNTRHLLLAPLFTLPTFLPFSAVAQSSMGFQTDAPHAVIIDYDTQEVMFTKDATRPMPPASMTKIMTAFMVFEAFAALSSNQEMMQRA